MTLRKRIAQLLELDQKQGKPGQIINLLLIVLISINVLAILLESVQEIYLQHQTAFTVLEWFSVAIFTVEYLARVWSSIDLIGMDDRSPFLGRLKYMMQPMALIDLAAILPFYLSLYINIDLRFLRVLRMLRLFKLTRYSPALSALLDVMQKEAQSLIAAIVVLAIMLVISASGIYLLENDIQPDVFGSIPAAMWWAMATLTTVGYGDVVPVTPMGKLFGSIIGLIGIGMVALPAAIMASGFAENLQRRRHRYNRYIEKTLSDGIIDEEERWELEKLRRELNLDSQEALELLDTMMKRIVARSPQSCPHCGKEIARYGRRQGDENPETTDSTKESTSLSH